MAGKSTEESDVVIIKKYANRRLYNTRSSSYITLDHLSKMTREGIDFKVVDAKTGADITHQILTQIIMEEESSGGEQILPVNFLRQLIGMYGNSMQSLLPHYLEASMENFRDNQLKLRKAFEESLGNNPLAQIAQLSGETGVANPEDHSFPVKLAAFTLSELKTAFQIGCMLFIPFLVIDLVVSSVLMAMGMMMLSPLVISLPLKLLLFVLVDGWTLTVNTLVSSVRGVAG